MCKITASNGDGTAVIDNASGQIAAFHREGCVAVYGHVARDGADRSHGICNGQRCAFAYGNCAAAARGAQGIAAVEIENDGLADGDTARHPQHRRRQRQVVIGDQIDRCSIVRLCRLDRLTQIAEIVSLPAINGVRHHVQAAVVANICSGVHRIRAMLAGPDRYRKGSTVRGIIGLYAVRIRQDNDFRTHRNAPCAHAGRQACTRLVIFHIRIGKPDCIGKVVGRRDGEVGAGDDLVAVEGRIGLVGGAR